MTQTIYDIANDCGLHIALDNRAVTDKEIEFFAEQIAKECASLCSNAADSAAILEHFGVKE